MQFRISLKTINGVLLTAFFIASFFLLPAVSSAQSEIEKLKADIEERGNRLEQIEKDIAKYENQLKQVGGKKSTLQSAINKLEVERKKIQADISYTEQKIGSTDLELNLLGKEIDITESNLIKNKEAIAEIIRHANKLEDQTLIEIFLSHNQLSEFWNSVETLQTVRSAMSNQVRKIQENRRLLGEKYGVTESKKIDLLSLKDQYSGQNQVLTHNKAEQTELLNATKNEEANYQKLLKDKQNARAEIEKELRDFESKIQFILNPNTIPSAGTAVFAWPLANFTITQYFGGTEFAARNPGIYGGRAYHPGIDLGAPTGTPIYAPLAGTVRDIGNTDSVPGCYSWGKWTLIDHANGLSTLYAHQSVISVSAGQKVNQGQIIGYVGATGYATGPHLHLTVYAKEGVTIRKFNEIKAVTSCGAAHTPVAATEAYLDPMLYLPK